MLNFALPATPVRPEASQPGRVRSGRRRPTGRHLESADFAGHALAADSPVCRSRRHAAAQRPAAGVLSRTRRPAPPRSAQMANLAAAREGLPQDAARGGRCDRCRDAAVRRAAARPVAARACQGAAARARDRFAEEIRGRDCRTPGDLRRCRRDRSVAQSERRKQARRAGAILRRARLRLRGQQRSRRGGVAIGAQGLGRQRRSRPRRACARRHRGRGDPPGSLARLVRLAPCIAAAPVAEERADLRAARDGAPAHGPAAGLADRGRVRRVQSHGIERLPAERSAGPCGRSEPPAQAQAALCRRGHPAGVRHRSRTGAAVPGCAAGRGNGIHGVCCSRWSATTS